MKVFKYGIALERLKEQDIELVRSWRNSDAVRLNMQYREIISEEQQKEWFRSINNLSNNYLMIHYKGEKIGLLNDKNINWEQRTSESGLFLGRTEYFNTVVPYFISIAGIEINFHFMGWQKQYAHILRDNKKAINFNTQLGYRLLPGQDDIENQKYEMTVESYNETSGKIQKAVRALATEDLLPRLLLEEDDFRSGFAKLIEPILTHRPEIICYENSEGKWYEQTY